MIIILWLIDIITISNEFDINIIVPFKRFSNIGPSVLDSHKGKTRSIIRRGLMR